MTRQAKYLTLRTLAASGFNNTFQNLGSALTDPPVVFKIVNNSDTDVLISTDGATEHDFVPAYSFTLYDLTANAGNDGFFSFSVGTQFTCKGAASGTGNVYLVILADK